MVEIGADRADGRGGRELAVLVFDELRLGRGRDGFDFAVRVGRRRQLDLPGVAGVARATGRLQGTLGFLRRALGRTELRDLRGNGRAFRLLRLLRGRVRELARRTHGLRRLNGRLGRVHVERVNGRHRFVRHGSFARLYSAWHDRRRHNTNGYDLSGFQWPYEIISFDLVDLLLVWSTLLLVLFIPNARRCFTLSSAGVSSHTIALE